MLVFSRADKREEGFSEPWQGCHEMTGIIGIHFISLYIMFTELSEPSMNRCENHNLLFRGKFIFSYNHRGPKPMPWFHGIPLFIPPNAIPTAKNTRIM